MVSAIGADHKRRHWGKPRCRGSEAEPVADLGEELAAVGHPGIAHASPRAASRAPGSGSRGRPYIPLNIPNWGGGQPGRGGRLGIRGRTEHKRPQCGRCETKHVREKTIQRSAGSENPDRRAAIRPRVVGAVHRRSPSILVLVRFKRKHSMERTRSDAKARWPRYCRARIRRRACVGRGLLAVSQDGPLYGAINRGAGI
jgi:hypothetical protein